jgi:predicted DNA binding protein
MGNMDNARKLKPALVLLALFAVSCGPQKPEVSTIVMHDTIYTDRVVSDTIVVSKPQDTIVMEKERLRVRVVRINDTLRIEGECAADTIYRTTTIEVPVKVVESRWPWWAKPLLWALFVLSVIYAVKKALSF